MGNHTLKRVSPLTFSMETTKSNKKPAQVLRNSWDQFEEQLADLDRVVKPI